MGKKTPLYESHIELKARMVDFAGWDMPVQYNSLIKEHKSVRSSAGMFDVSHMLAIDIFGTDSKVWLQKLLANDAAKLSTPGKALYSCMLNEGGGVIDDLILYFVKHDHFRMVVNAGTRDKDINWMKSQIGKLDIMLTPRIDLAIIAVQGPSAREKVIETLSPHLSTAASKIKRFSSYSHGNWFLGRTGYTGEDGFEVMLPADDALAYWRKLLDKDVQPVGLGARDTLRLEAGMNLYGNDMDENYNPLNSGLKWTVAFEPDTRQFIGRNALEEIRGEGLRTKLVGLVLQARGVLREHLDVYKGDQKIGQTTSGSYSPSLSKSIALARINSDVNDVVTVEIRGRKLPAIIINPPFINKDGKANF